MISDVKKEDVSKQFTEHSQTGHWYYTSLVGKVSLAVQADTDCYKKQYEIYSWEKLFPDVEFYSTMEEAEKRIMELLA